MSSVDLFASSFVERFEEIKHEIVNEINAPGIVYLRQVPVGMNVSRAINFFSGFGRVGRVFLAKDHEIEGAGSIPTVFNEGWIEFLCRKVAKSVADKVNNLSDAEHNKKRNRRAPLNLEFLPRLKWSQLSEKLDVSKAQCRWGDIKALSGKRKTVGIEPLKRSKSRTVRFEELSPAAATATPFCVKKSQSQAKKSKPAVKKTKREEASSLRAYPRRLRSKPARYDSVLSTSIRGACKGSAKSKYLRTVKGKSNNHIGKSKRARLSVEQLTVPACVGSSPEPRKRLRRSCAGKMKTN